MQPAFGITQTNRLWREVRGFQTKKNTEPERIRRRHTGIEFKGMNS